MTKIRVLLVEDNRDNQDMMRFLLERAGYLVYTADNGVEALRRARDIRPDVILMDLSLPELDGWSAARELRADEDLKDIPLIAVTAHTLPGDRRRALDAGFDSYISKPINVRTFDNMVANVVGKRNRLP